MVSRAVRYEVERRDHRGVALEVLCRVERTVCGVPRGILAEAGKVPLAVRLGGSVLALGADGLARSDLRAIADFAADRTAP